MLEGVECATVVTLALDRLEARILAFRGSSAPRSDRPEMLIGYERASIVAVTLYRDLGFEGFGTALRGERITRLRVQA